MRLFVFLLVCLLSGSAFADLKVEAEFKPEFKWSRLRAFLNEGDKAEFRYVIHNDGSVRDLSVTYSIHPKMVEIIEDTVALWRYKPWSLKDGPSTLEVEHSTIITFDPNLKRTIRIKVLNMRCRELNREVIRFRKLNPGKPLLEMDAFSDLRWASWVSYEEFTVDEMSRWFEIFEDAFPVAVESCKENPGAMYIKYLPGVLRERIQSSPRRAATR